jgi:S1-C subfamily serine protease
MAGVVSAKIHEIPAADGLAIGIGLKKDSEELIVDEVYPGGGAADAGMKKDDRILEVAGKAIKVLKELSESLKPYHAGSRVPFKIRRGKETLELQVRLDPKKDLFANKLENQPQDRNDQMSGDFSNRRSGFPRVLQHSILGSSKIVGGPVLDLEGHCIGMNIARANRAESFAIPVEDVKEIAQRLLAEAAKNPAVVSPAPEQK